MSGITKIAPYTAGTSLLVSIGTAFYFNNRLNELDSTTDKYNSKLAVIIKKLKDMQVHDVHISHLADAVKNVTAVSNEKSQMLEYQAALVELLMRVVEEQSEAIEEMQAALEADGKKLTKKVRTRVTDFHMRDPRQQWGAPPMMQQRSHWDQQPQYSPRPSQQPMMGGYGGRPSYTPQSPRMMTQSPPRDDDNAFMEQLSRMSQRT